MESVGRDGRRAGARLASVKNRLTCSRYQHMENAGSNRKR